MIEGEEGDSGGGRGKEGRILEVGRKRGGLREEKRERGIRGEEEEGKGGRGRGGCGGEEGEEGEKGICDTVAACQGNIG